MMILPTLAQLQLDLDVFRDGGGGGGAWAALARLAVDPRFWALLVTVAGAAGVTVAAADLIRRDRERGGPASRMIARSLGLSRREMRLLKSLARSGDFPSPACIMISRGCFCRSVEQYRSIAGIGGEHPSIESLQRRLFDEPPEQVHS